MTIRDLLARRKLVWLVVMLSLGAIAFAAFIIDRDALPQWLFYIGFVSALGFILCFMPLSFFVLRCPRCSSSLDVFSKIGNKGLLYRSAHINYCPYCGVSLDEPAEH